MSRRHLAPYPLAPRTPSTPLRQRGRLPLGALLALLVLAVCVRMALDLTVMPEDLFVLDTRP